MRRTVHVPSGASQLNRLSVSMCWVISMTLEGSMIDPWGTSTASGPNPGRAREVGLARPMGNSRRAAQAEVGDAPRVPGKDAVELRPHRRETCRTGKLHRFRPAIAPVKVANLPELNPIVRNFQPNGSLLVLVGRGRRVRHRNAVSRERARLKRLGEFKLEERRLVRSGRAKFDANARIGVDQYSSVNGARVGAGCAGAFRTTAGFHLPAPGTPAQTHRDSNPAWLTVASVRQRLAALLAPAFRSR